MGQVTIGELTEDLVPYTERGNKIVNVAIIPRLIAERIIDKCKADMEEAEETENPDRYEEGKWEEALKIMNEVALSLLEFEEGVAGVAK